jgi:hypothetical protein
MHDDLTRRGLLGTAAVSLGGVYSGGSGVTGATQARRPNSTFNGVRVGAIAPYTFRNEVNTAGQVLDRLVQLGLSWVEVQTPLEYDVQVSADGASWSTVARGQGTKRHTDLSFNPVGARFLRINQTGTARPGPWPS